MLICIYEMFIFLVLSLFFCLQCFCFLDLRKYFLAHMTGLLFMFIDVVSININ